MRIGTGLWHGDKAALHLGANVIDFHPVKAGAIAGYHGTVVADNGHLVVIGAGTAHGVEPLADGRSPFHYMRRRLDLVERPHMHTSLVLVPDGAVCPQAGDVVDVQRPLISVSVDEVIWQ
jgi:alanine racemase